jgi:diketogulonate reductase-like aldo/keto reductase
MVRLHFARGPTAVRQAGAKVKPEYVQKRCFAHTGWEKEIRAICKEHGVIFQGYSVLTANKEVLKNAQVQEYARYHRKTAQQIVFRFALQLGITPLTGSSSEEHLLQDLEAYQFELSDDEMMFIERSFVKALAGRNGRPRGR